MDDFDRNEDINLPEVKKLILELYKHPVTPDWLKDELWETLNNNAHINAYDPAYMELMLNNADWNDNKTDIRYGGRSDE